MLKLSQKLNLILILSVGISVVISSIVISYRYLNEVNTSRTEKDYILVDGLANNFESFFNNAVTLNYQLSINSEVVETITNAKSNWIERYKEYEERYVTWDVHYEKSGDQLLRNIVNYYNYVDLLYIQDSNGNQTAKSNGSIRQHYNRWWYKRLNSDRDKRAFISHVYYSVTGYVPVSSIFHPIFKDDEYIGILGMDLNFERLQELIGLDKITNDMYVIITDMNGVIIAHNRPDKIEYMYNLKEMSRSTIDETSKEVLNNSGYIFMEKETLDWPIEMSFAVSAAIKGETGSIETVNLDGIASDLYYTPVNLPTEGNSEEHYTVLLVHNRSEVIITTRVIMISVTMFILLCTTILYIIFRKIFKRNIITPLSILIKSMEDIDPENFKEIKLDTKDEFTLLAETYNNLGKNLQENIKHLRESEAGYKTFADIGIALSKEQNIDSLLQLILERSMEQTRADGGTLYLYNKKKEQLDFVIMQTVSKNYYAGGISNNPVTVPPVPLYNNGEKNYLHVSAFSALSGEVVNIPDVYNAESFNFKGTRTYDKNNNYRSKSMLVVPMKNMDNELIGVIQLINARKKDSDEIRNFSEIDESLSISLASQAAVAITNVNLNKDMENLFYSFIKSIATTVDEKSPFTGGHVKRVVDLTTLIAKEINITENGYFKDISFTNDELEELRISAWMHDIGKVSTPENLINKETKLQGYTDGMELIDMRYNMLINNISFPDNNSNNYEKEKLIDELSFLHSCNKPGEFLSNEKIEKLMSIHKREFHINGRCENFITSNELENLSIVKGNLNKEERYEIERHAEITKKILSKLQFPKNLSNVAKYASMHHEKLDGTGYPEGLKGDQIPLQARIIAVADIFEALTAKDRPYREPMKLSKVIDVMNYMVKDNHIDSNITKLLIETKIIQTYAEKELYKDQIDIFHIN